jgi:hypothetical protein
VPRLVSVLTFVGLAILAGPAEAILGPPPTPFERALKAEVVVVGKVTVIEKDAVEIEVKGTDGRTDKFTYRVAVVKIGEAVAGAKGLTHIRVGFFPADPRAPDARTHYQGIGSLALTEGEEGCFFLRKHPSGDFYVIPWRLLPLDPKEDGYKARLEKLRRGLAAAADPITALKAERPEDRYAAAVALVYRYRTYPDLGKYDEVPIPADENRLILRAFAERDWTKSDPDLPSPFSLTGHLGMSPQDGYDPKDPAEPKNWLADRADYFRRWVEKDGQKFVLKKLVRRK